MNSRVAALELCLQPFLKFGLGALQCTVVQKFAQKSHGDGTGAQVEAAVGVIVGGGLIDVQFVVEVLQPVLHASQREAAAPRNRAIGQAQRYIDEDFVFGIGEAVGVADAFLLQAPHSLSITHWLSTKIERSASFSRSSEADFNT